LCRGESREGWRKVGPTDSNGFTLYRRADDQHHRGNGHAPTHQTTRPPIDWYTKARQYEKKLTPTRREELARLLGLPVESLDAFPLLGYTPYGVKQSDDTWVPSWMLPMYDGEEHVIGVAKRFPFAVSVNGGDPTNKATAAGSRQGLYIPQGWRDRPGGVHLVEGGTDTIAGTVAGLSMIGRPSNTAGVDHLVRLLRDVPADRPVTVLGENDRKGNGAWPGKEGVESTAPKLADGLRRPVQIVFPPSKHKDVREWVLALLAGQGESADWSAIGDTIRRHCEATAVTVEPSDAIVFESLDGIQAKPVRWEVLGRIPRGKLVLVAANGGEGKSTFCRHLVSKVTSGRPACGVDYVPDNPGEVILFAEEDGVEDVVIPSLVAEGADLSKVFRIPFVASVDAKGVKSRVRFGLEHLEMLKTELKRRPKVRVIVIDPIASFVGRCKIDDHKQTELRRVLDPLNDLAESTGVTVILVAHINKTNGDRAVYRIAGSATYANAVRLAYVLTTDPDDEDGERRLLMPVKHNLLGLALDSLAFRLVKLKPDEVVALRTHKSFAHLTDTDFAAVADQLARLEYDAAVNANADEVMRCQGKKTGGNKVEKCKAFLREFLAKYAYPSEEIVAAADAAGFTFDNVKEAKAKLKLDGLRNSTRGVLRGTWWSGFGEPETWTLRPDRKPVTDSTPHSPFSPHTPLSPFSPHIGNTRDFLCGESGETGESGEYREQGEKINHDPDPASNGRYVPGRCSKCGKPSGRFASTCRDCDAAEDAQ
jgi:RecA-family ATPase